jgi:hypothetical protein
LNRAVEAWLKSFVEVAIASNVPLQEIKLIRLPDKAQSQNCVALSESVCWAEDRPLLGSHLEVWKKEVLIGAGIRLVS